MNDMTRFLSLRPYLPSLALVAVCLAAFIAIAILSDQIFEHVPHSEDEVAYLFQAKVFAQNRLAVPTPPYRQAFWTPFVVDYQGQRFGKYPPGWPFLLSFGVRLNAPWLVNALLGTLTLVLIAWLGCCFYKKDTRLKKTECLHDMHMGLWAAGLGLITPGFLFLSSSLLSHPASLFWSTVALVGLFYTIKENKVKYKKNTSRFTFHVLRFTFHASPGQWIYAILVGATLGAAFVTRPFAGAGIGLAVGIFLLVLIFQGEIKWITLLWLLPGGLSIAALLPFYWWVISGDPFFNAYLLVWPYDRIGFGPDIGPLGYNLSDALFANTRLKFTALAGGLFGWPGWSNLLFLPIPFLARRANRWDWLLLGTLFSLIFGHTFYWAFGGADGGFPRYYYDALPALLLLTVRGIHISREYLGRWLPIGLVTLFISYNLIWNLPSLLAVQKGKYSITAVQLRAVEQAHLPTPALVMVKNVKIWSDFAAPFAANSPTLDGPVVYASDEGPELTQKLRQHFQERTCWELEGEEVKRCMPADSSQ